MIQIELSKEKKIIVTILINMLTLTLKFASHQTDYRTGKEAF